MNLLSLSQAPTGQQAKFFRHGWVMPAVVIFGLVAFAVLIICEYAAGRAPKLILIFVPGFLLFLWLFTETLLCAFKPTNWLFALGLDRLWIKYRSYLNSHLPQEDLQVIELPYAEIESVCLIRRKEISCGNKGGKRIQFLKYLEFTLRELLEQSFSDALQAEREAKDCSMRRVRGKSGDYPVRINGDRTFRVHVNFIHPNPRKVLKELEINGVTVLLDKREVQDFTKSVSDKRQMEDHLIELVEQGKTIAAIKIARQRYGMGLAEAKQFIDGLSSR